MLSGDSAYPGQTLINELAEPVQRQTFMVALAELMLDLAGNLMAQVRFMLAAGKGSYFTLTPDILGCFTLLPGYLHEFFFLPARGFSPGKGFLPFFGQSHVYPGQLLIPCFIPGQSRAASHVKEAIGNLDVRREELTRHFVPQQFVGDKAERCYILSGARGAGDGFVAGCGYRRQASLTGERGETGRDRAAHNI